MVPYEFSISSLFLSRGFPDQCEIEQLVDLDITNMEVALSSWLPDSSGLRSGKFDREILRCLTRIKSGLHKKGVNVIGLHSVFFEACGLNVFDKCADTLEFLVSRIQYCDELGGRFLVIGSPSARRTKFDHELSLANYRWLLDAALERTKESNVVILTEALPMCSVFQTASDLISLSKSFESDRIGVHLDVNSLLAAGDMDFLLSADLQLFQHVHINTLDFRPVEVDERRSELEQFFRILHKHNYNQLLGLEYVTPASSSPDFDSLNWSKKYLKERMPK